MPASPDVQGMVNDPEFLGMPPAQQKEALFKLTGDDSFNSLKPGEVMAFASRLRATPAVLNRPQLPTPAQVVQPIVQSMQPFGDSGPAAGKLTGLPGVNPHSPTAGEMVGDVALASSPAMIGPARAVEQAAVQQLAKHPVAGPVIGSYLIDKAKQIPYVGDVIKRVPYAEMIPWLAGMKPGTTAEAEGAAATKAAGKKVAEPIPQGAEALASAPTPKAQAASQTGEALGTVRTSGTGFDAMESALKKAPAETQGTPVELGNWAKEKGSPYVGHRVPDMQLLDSTTVSKAGYNPDKQHLVVEFRNGNVYSVRGVPQKIADEFFASESHGSYYARNIKGRYDTERWGSVLGKKR